MKLGGIDVGTTGCKLTVYNEKGELINKEYVSYEVKRSVGEHELDGAVIWDGVKTLIKKTTERIGNIDAIGVTTFGETFVMLDGEDNILHPSMLYTDPRGTEEANSFDAEAVMKIAGVKPHAMYSLPKMMWIKKNKPEIYEKAKRIMLFEDYIVYMLTGTAQIDQTLAARTMGLDIRRCEWSGELFRFAGIDTDKMSKVVKSGTSAGKIKPKLEAELGLCGTCIVNGCHDQAAAAAGSGVFDTGTAVDGTGTVECVTPVFDKIPENKQIYDEGYSVVPYIEDGKYVCYALSFTGGAAVKWFRDNLAKDKSYKELDAEIDDEPGSILVMPHFSGAANPYMDSFSKAAFLGVTLESTRQDLYKAVMEGVTYEMLLNIKHLEKAGIVFEKLYAAGGGASSPVWPRMKANILGIPITSIDAPEVGTVGTIMLTGVAVGAFKNMEEAKRIMVKEGKTYFPDEKKHKKHLKIFNRYDKIYRAVRPLLKEDENE